jgi:enoyl-CoA hydratase/carnithine racemase
MTQVDEVGLKHERIRLLDGADALLLTFNRPAQLNPLDWPVFNELEQRLIEADTDPAIRVVLITGQGRAFSAGGDLKGYQELMRDPVEYPRFLADAHRTFLLMRSVSIPVISLVNGVAVAGGFETILFSDWAYAAESARIGDSHLTFGMMGGGGVLTLLPRTIPPARARELVFSGRILSADEALEWGIVNRVVADDALLDAGLEAARGLAEKSPLAVANAKEILNSVSYDGSSLEAGLRREFELTCRYVLTADDPHEGLRAFSEKRAPRFTGR